MVESQELTFPDLPVEQWWKLRTLFKGNLPKTVNIDYIMSTLNIKESTAGNTFRNLTILGLIDKDGKTSDRANNWRSDDLYPQVCKEITEQVYPQDLQDIAQASSDRNTLVSWFTRKTKIGEKAAHKNAAIFEVISKGELVKAKEPKEGKVQPRPRSQGRPKKVLPPPKEGVPAVSKHIQPEKPILPSDFVSPSVHIDIQIHLAPDAPASQIQEIFIAIEKHLYRERKAGE
jgi:predicted transcriptional regulator